ncbi:hypothetical protein FGO68_gene3926 [Halteria grandinella]|uniref:Uncharacterized protein n=1 Tax=Halteria grandinella TaxID=5974 RepID=A0A8J8NYH9_HALGN|nr:hypothetical protein FGO68_gene3926 [Halteria grandinella]
MASIEEPLVAVIADQETGSIIKQESSVHSKQTISQRVSPAPSLTNSRVLRQPEIVIHPAPSTEVSGIIGEHLPAYNVERTRQQQSEVPPQESTGVKIQNTSTHQNAVPFQSARNPHDQARIATGLTSAQYQMPVQEIIVTCNKLAMTALAGENYKECYTFLKRSEAILDDTKQKMLLSAGSRGLNYEQMTKLYSLTMNNMGCYYKKIQRPNVALKYMMKALNSDLELQRQSNRSMVSTIASTKLNICAILSLLGKHQEALGYVKSAIYDYQDLLERKQAQMMQQHPGSEEQEKTEGAQPPVNSDDDEINYFSLLQSLSIAYFNEGVEHEHLKDYHSALSSYTRSRDFALQVSEGSGGGNDAMLVNADRSIEEVSVKLQQSEEVKSRRVMRRENLDTMRLFRDQQHLRNIDNMQKERFDTMLQSVMMRVSKENKDELSIQNWNERIGKQFNYSRFFSKRPTRFTSPFNESPAKSSPMQNNAGIVQRGAVYSGTEINGMIRSGQSTGRGLQQNYLSDHDINSHRTRTTATNKNLLFSKDSVRSPQSPESMYGKKYVGGGQLGPLARKGIQTQKMARHQRGGSTRFPQNYPQVQNIDQSDPYYLHNPIAERILDETLPIPHTEVGGEIDQDMILYEGRKIEDNTHYNIYSSEVNSRQKGNGIFSSGQQYNQSGQQQGRSQTSHNSVRANKRINARVYQPIAHTNQPSSPNQSFGKYNTGELNRNSNEDLGQRISSTGNSRYRGGVVVPPLFKPTNNDDVMQEFREERIEDVNGWLPQQRVGKQTKVMQGRSKPRTQKNQMMPSMKYR